MSYGFNVMDFGAKGDGLTDDTAAIQAAINAAHKQMTFLPAGRTEIPKWGGHGGLGGGGLGGSFGSLRGLLCSLQRLRNSVGIGSLGGSLGGLGLCLGSLGGSQRFLGGQSGGLGGFLVLSGGDGGFGSSGRN